MPIHEFKNCPSSLIPLTSATCHCDGRPLLQHSQVKSQHPESVIDLRKA